MLFNSLVFLIFAAIFFGIWPFVRRFVGTRSIFIVCASFIFYGWWDWRFLFLIIASGLVDYFCALGIERYSKAKKFFLCLSLFCNIGSLAIFKYLDFFIANLNGGSELLSSPLNIPAAELILPVGISFYTFQSMSYTIDVYKGEMKPTRNIGHFFAYLSMFPQLVAGPIVRAKDLIPALESPQELNQGDIWIGFRWIVHGYFKKMVIADSFAPVVATAFGSTAVASSTTYWWCVVLMWAFQIYCDFSGYSDIARGLGKWMGFDFPENFNHPYVARGFRDFWSRWHISLSTWFRDYVYVPLGGSRVTPYKAHFNMWVTMLVSGLWHGAAWTFIAWGALHALYLSVERWTKWPKMLEKFGPIGNLVAIGITVFLTCIAWVYFRAESFGQANAIVAQLFNVTQLNTDYALQKIGMFQFLWLGAAVSREAFFALGINAWSVFHKPWFENVRVVTLAVVIVMTILFRGPGATFVYFQF
jgi:D-alanyl-lipoteichoic acid acyltransferase DltB (MBOAT superfamily)